MLRLFGGGVAVIYNIQKLATIVSVEKPKLHYIPKQKKDK